MVYGLWFMVYGLWFMVYGLGLEPIQRVGEKRSVVGERREERPEPLNPTPTLPYPTLPTSPVNLVLEGSCTTVLASNTHTQISTHKWPHTIPGISIVDFDTGRCKVHFTIQRFQSTYVVIFIVFTKLTTPVD